MNLWIFDNAIEVLRSTGPSEASRCSLAWLNEEELSVLRAFVSADVQFLIIGGHAVQFHGYLRPTKDLDLLVETSPENGRRLIAALKILGTDSTDPGRFENLSEHRRAKGAVCYYPVEFLTAVNGVRFLDAWSDATLTTVNGLALRVLSRRHLISSKQNTGRLCDADDVKALQGRS